MGKCKFNNSWLEKKDENDFKISIWCKRQGDYDFFCRCCCSIVSVEKKGFQALIQHSGTAKHIKLCKEKYGTNQTHLLCPPETSETETVAPPAGLQVVSPKESACVAEIIWVLKLVLSNYSFSSCNGIQHIFAVMFSDSVVTKDFTLCPKKVHYLLNYALYPYFYEQMIEDAQRSLYSLSYDETTNVESKKELIITVTFWSEKKNEVVARHLQTFLLGKADAKTIQQKLMIAINEAGLSLQKLLMIACDGPNVNKKVLSLMNEEVKAVRKKSLLEVGTCNIHIVHNAYLQGLQAFGEEASDMVTMIFLYFDGWPSRCEEFESMQKELGMSTKKFLKHVPSRWLTFKPAAQRLLDLWKPVTQYFLKYIPTKKSQVAQTSSFKKIVHYLKDPTMKAQILFGMSSADLFTKFTSKFQSDSPQIHNLYEALMELVYSIIGRVCRNQDLASTLDESQIFDSNNLLPLNEIVIPSELQKYISGFKEKERLVFLKGVQSHYIHACKHLILKSALKSNLVKALKCLSPACFSSSSPTDIVTVAKALPIEISEEILVDEWKLLQYEDLQNRNYSRLDHFWNEFFSASSKFEKFPTINKVVKAALSLSHGNADIERRFSISRWALTEDRASMSERTLNSIMIVKDELRLHRGCPQLIPISKKLISYAHSARKRYFDFLEEEKRKQELQQKRIEEEEKLKEEEKKKFRKAEKDRASIEKISVELQEKSAEYCETRKLSKQLFSEASERLERGIKSKNLDEIQLANAMIQGVKRLQEEESLKHEEVTSLSKDVDKKKNTLITSFFSKKPKL